MIHKSNIVGFVRPHKRYSERAQRDALQRHGIAKIYTDLDLCIRQRRKGHGDVVAVTRALLLADPRDLRKLGGLRQSMWSALDRIEAKGASVWEIETDRQTSDPRERDVIIRESVETLARTRPNAKPPGRPPATWSDDAKAIMWRHWPSMAYDTDGAALDAINAALAAIDIKAATLKQVKRVCGASGRRGGPKPRHKS
jgi:hypothetical protein